MPSTTTTTTTQPNGGATFSANSVIERAQSQWLFTPAELLKSPSILEGMPPAQELANRHKGVKFITQVGIMLKLPQLTLATASVFLHRFYMRHPMQVSSDKGIHHYQVAATALFLATKVEENCRKMRELVVACCRVAQKQPNLVVDDQSREYWRWRDTILHNEDVLLEALCFDLQLELPYRILFDFLCYYRVQEHKNLRNASWAFLSDSHITMLCLLFPPRTIAGSALYAGVKLTGVTLPDDEDGKPWWQHLELDIYDIQKACNTMAEAYENPTLARQGQKDAYLKEDDIMSFDRTRRTQSPSIDMSPAYSQRSASQGMKRDREDSWGHEQRFGLSDLGAPSQDSITGHLSSPKRPRRDSHSNGDSIKNSRPTGSGGLRVPTSTVPSLDDVQQKIDDIVNASGTTSGQQSNGGKSPRHSAPATENASNGTAKTLANGAGTTQRDRRPSQPADIDEKQRHNRESDSGGPKTSGDIAEEVDYGSEEGEV